MVWYGKDEEPSGMSDEQFRREQAEYLRRKREKERGTMSEQKRDPAEEAFYEWANENCPEILDPAFLDGKPPPQLEVWLAAARAEREACATKCDLLDEEDGWDAYAKAAAAAIRARSPE